jgi:glutamine cyclotransferase
MSSYLDLTGLLPRGQGRQQDAVLNGIAYDQATRRLFVSGSSGRFEIRVR